jgi:hypothetical protein
MPFRLYKTGSEKDTRCFITYPARSHAYVGKAVRIVNHAFSRKFPLYSRYGDKLYNNLTANFILVALYNGICRNSSCSSALRRSQGIWLKQGI